MSDGVRQQEVRIRQFERLRNQSANVEMPRFLADFWGFEVVAHKKISVGSDQPLGYFSRGSCLTPQVACKHAAGRERHPQESPPPHPMTGASLFRSGPLTR